MSLPVWAQSAGLLVISNVFMTFAWYAHLRNMAAKPWVIAALARKELRDDLRQRRALLDAAAGLLDDARVTVGSDGYPRLAGTYGGDSRISLEVVPDSLVPRRLPQLWLRLTLLAPEAAPRPSIGVLARPIGTEFYSRVLGLPESIAPSFTTDFPLLMRGRGVEGVLASLRDRPPELPVRRRGIPQVPRTQKH